MFDTHLHTKFSTDSNMTIDEVLQSIKKNNLKVIITEHMDLNYKDKNQFRFDIDEYFKRYSHFSNNDLLLGMEIGMSNKYSGEYKDMVTKYSFDYIIGSLHEMYDTDLYEADQLYESMSKKNLYEKYLLQMVSCINEHPFIDSLGHIDYICRYAKYEDKEIYYEDYSDAIEELLNTLINKGIVIELNTRRLDSEEAVDNLIKIYNRYYELGGKYITIGSDAHNIRAIGCNFKVAKEIAEFCHLRMVYFKNRKMELV